MGKRIDRLGTTEEWKGIEQVCSSAEDGSSPSSLTAFTQEALHMVSIKAWATLLSWQALPASTGQQEASTKDDLASEGTDIAVIDEEIQALEDQLRSLEGDATTSSTKKAKAAKTNKTA